MSNISKLNWSASFYEASQSNHGGDRGTTIRTSILNLGSEGQTDLCNESTLDDDRSREVFVMEVLE